MTRDDPPLVAAIRRHHASIGRALRALGVAEADVDDLAQEVLAIFCRRFSDIAEPAQQSFLRETARRVAADHRSLAWNRAILGKVDDDIAETEPRGPERQLERHQARELVHDALCALTESDRRIFLLSHFEHYSRTLIAEQLGVPSGTVASRLRRANDVFSSAVARLLDQNGRGAAALAALPPWSAPARRLGHVTLAPNAAPLVGTHRYIDNQWGRARANAGYDQCLLERQQGERSELGWSWNWPGYHRDGFALPELLVGWKPWLGGPSTDPRFPLRLEHIRRLWAVVDVECDAIGAQELVLNCWILRAKPNHDFPNPDLISAEIMVELDYGPGVPSSKHVESLILGEHRFDLREQSEAQGARVEPWPLLSLKRSEPSASTSFDVAAMLRALTSRGCLESGHYLASIELGSRVFGGEGTAWVKRFELDVEA